MSVNSRRAKDVRPAPSVCYSQVSPSGHTWQYNSTHMVAPLVSGTIFPFLWYYNRENEDNIWKEELNVLGLIKNTIDENIKLIESGNAEKIIIENENKI